MIYPDTAVVWLAAIGHLNEPNIIKSPDHALYSKLKKDSTGLPLYYYSPQEGFHGTDSVMFKSVEPSLKQTLISTYYFTVH